ncbi:hypothetical protein HDF12_000557 [Edaphobacter lichenicola]|uniref:Uncharacterized protein n=1 Tax=Tunturiibacter lichenicola TaxID=2051959 RepID=A0A7Y9NJB4_9BACT|nr:hypothetical protein [Edaphobacter lichenicola]
MGEELVLLLRRFLRVDGRRGKKAGGQDGKSYGRFQEFR